MKWIHTILALFALTFLHCADEQQAEEPVQQEEEDQDDQADNQEDEEYSDDEGDADDVDLDDAAGADYGDAEPEPAEDAATSTPPVEPMKEDDKGGGGIISGGVKPQPGDEMSIDCEETTMAAPKGWVMFGCKAMVGGQKAPAIRGQWRPFSDNGQRVKMRDVQFNQGSYDVVFAVRKSDAAKGFTMKKK